MLNEDYKFETDTIVSLVDRAIERLDTELAQSEKRLGFDRRFMHYFGTVQVSLQRGVGHSTAIFRLAEKYSSHLIFVPTYRDKYNFLRHYTEKYYPATRETIKVIEQKIITLENAENRLQTQVQSLYHNKIISAPSLIMVDGFSRLSPAAEQNLEFLYALVDTRTLLYVLLQ